MLRIGIYGQSNAANMSSVAASPPAAASGTDYFNGTSVIAVPSANGVRELLNGIKTLTGVDCRACNGAVAGVPIASLVKGQSNYTAFLAQLQSASMGGCDYIYWHQGEGDANANTGSPTWVNSLTQLHSDLASDLSTTTAAMPMIVSSLATHTSSVYGKDRYARQQKSIQDAAAGNIYFSHSNIDATLSDGLHWTGASYGRSGQRAARTISWLHGDVTGPAAWFITGASYVSPTQTLVTVTHSVGTDFTPTSGITGFEVCSGGIWITATGARASATTILLTHVAATASRQVRYQYGETPDVTAPVVDNSAISSALVLTKTTIAVDSQPVPVFIDWVSTTGTGSTISATLTTETAFTNRRIICMIVASSASQILSSATIGSNSATVHHASNSNSMSLACISAVVNTGTSLTVSLTYSGGVFSGASVFAYEVDDTKIGAQTDIQVARTTTATQTSLNLNNDAGGFTLALGVSSNTTSNSGGFLIADVDTATRIDVASGGFQGVMMDSFGQGAYTSRPLAVRFTQSGTTGLLAASWPPASAVNQLRWRLR